MRECRDGLTPGKGYHFQDRPYVQYAGVIPAAEHATVIAQLQSRLDALVAADIPTAVDSGTKASPVMAALGVRPEFLQPYGDDQVRCS